MLKGSVVTVVIGSVIAVAACKKPDETPQKAATSTPAATGAAASPVTAGRAPGGSKVDKTAGQDGPLTGDSAPDGVITLSVEGPLTSLAVVMVDATGAPDKQNQWDTVVEAQPIPAAWKVGFTTGSETWQLGVEENGKMLNAKNGSLTPIGPGRHSLLLYYGDASHTTGAKLMVLGERPDHTVVKSNVFN